MNNQLEGSQGEHLATGIAWTATARRISLALLTALISAGCATDFAAPTVADPGTTFGRIYIDTPEVYSRERLVNDRFVQDAWLRTRLRENPAQGLAGSMGTSRQSATSFSLAAGVSATPPPSVVAEGAAAPQPLVDGPIEQFRDVLAYREEVRSEMLENQLDDRHDIAGNTLYRLKFDATVVPLHDTSAYAMVEVTVKGREGDKPSEGTDLLSRENFLDWEAENNVTLPQYDTARYLPGLDERTFGLYALSYINWVRDIDPSKYTREEIKYGPLKRYVNITEYDPDYTGDIELHIWEKKDCAWVANDEQYELLYDELEIRGVPPEYVEISYYTEEVYGEDYVEINQYPEICVLTGLASFIWDVRHRNSEVYTYAVTPKERVQRVYGDNATAGALGLSVGAEQDGLGAAFAHTRAREARANAIMRQPQLVGYSPNAHRQDEATMGWLIGPRYQLSDDADGTVSFRHVPTQVSLTGVISVPSWWTELELVTRTYWLDENGREYALDGTPLDGGVESMPGTTSSITLPGDMTTIAEVLDPNLREPRVEEAAVTPDELVACEPGSMVIRGHQLWRSTVVTLGGYPATAISVLPNMKGLIATFDTVQPSITDSEALYLWTSEGGVHAGDMKISGPSKCEERASAG